MMLYCPAIQHTEDVCVALLAMLLTERAYDDCNENGEKWKLIQQKFIFGKFENTNLDVCADSFPVA